MIMKLYESLQQLFRQYGHGILQEESIVTKLTGLRAFDGSPALRDAMKCLSESGCLRELLTRSRRNIASDFALYTGYLRKSLEESWHFDHDTALLAVDSLSFALGHPHCLGARDGPRRSPCTCGQKRRREPRRP